MLDLRQRMFVRVSIVLLIILGVVLLILVFRRESSSDFGDDQPVVPDAGSEVEESPTVFDPSLNLPPVIGNPNEMAPLLANEDERARYARQLAGTFVERFLSYSNQTRNQHIQDVLPLVTESMGSWVRSQALAYSSEYVGSTTNVVVSRIDVIDTTSATVHIEAQQRLESQHDVTMVQHTGRVELIEQDGQWYVDGLYWD